MPHKPLLLAALASLLLLTAACQKQSATTTPPTDSSTSTQNSQTPDTVPLSIPATPTTISTANPATLTPETGLFESSLCSWMKETPVLIHFNVPESLRDQSVYIGGFQYTVAGSSLPYNLARMARSGCDYWVGFYADETADIVSARVVAYGGDHNEINLQFANLATDLQFVDGAPVSGKILEVQVTGATVTE